MRRIGLPSASGPSDLTNAGGLAFENPYVSIGRLLPQQVSEHPGLRPMHNAAAPRVAMLGAVHRGEISVAPHPSGADTRRSAVPASALAYPARMRVRSDRNFFTAAARSRFVARPFLSNFSPFFANAGLFPPVFFSPPFNQRPFFCRPFFISLFFFGNTFFFFRPLFPSAFFFFPPPFSASPFQFSGFFSPARFGFVTPCPSVFFASGSTFFSFPSSYLGWPGHSPVC
jgi:hypothetical protein